MARCGVTPTLADFGSEQATALSIFRHARGSLLNLETQILICPAVGIIYPRPMKQTDFEFCST
jgi:hypothetical protein